MMNKTFFVITLSFLLTSCATILNKKSYDLKVSSNLENSKVKVYDSIYHLPNKVKVNRSNEDLRLTLISDSTNIDYLVKASPNPKFLYLNLVGAYMAPLNYAIDFTNQKRFYYGKSIFLNSMDTLRTIKVGPRKFWSNYFSKTYPKKKGNINAFLSIPYVNGFNFRPQDYGLKVNTGFFGFSTGLEYFYKDSKYLAFNATVATDFLAPFPTSVSYDGSYERLNTFYFGITDNIKISRLSFGYGLNYSINKWTYTDDTDSNNTIKIKRKNQSLGLTTNTYYQFGKYFFVGFVYRPTLYNISPKSKFEYEHLYSLEFVFKPPVRK